MSLTLGRTLRTSLISNLSKNKSNTCEDKGKCKSDEIYGCTGGKKWTKKHPDEEISCIKNEKKGLAVVRKWDCPAQENCRKAGKCEVGKIPISCCGENFGKGVVSCVGGKSVVGKKLVEGGKDKIRPEPCEEGVIGGPIEWILYTCVGKHGKHDCEGIRACYELAKTDPAIVCPNPKKVCPIPTLAEYTCTNEGAPIEKYTPVQVYGGTNYRWDCPDKKSCTFLKPNPKSVCGSKKYTCTNGGTAVKLADTPTCRQDENGNSVTKMVHHWNCPNELGCKIEPPGLTVTGCNINTTDYTCDNTTKNGCIAAGTSTTVTDQAINKNTQNHTCFYGSKKTYTWECPNSPKNSRCTPFTPAGQLCCTKKQVDDGVPECQKKTACSCGTATAPCPNSLARQGDTKAGVSGSITTASAACTNNSQANKVTSSWTCRAGTSCLENSSCSEVTTVCPGLTCSSPRSGRFSVPSGKSSTGRCSDRSSVTATLGSTDTCAPKQRGGMYNFEWTCGGNSCTHTINTCHVPPKCGTTAGSCAVGTTDDANPSLSADPCPDLIQANRNNNKPLSATRSYSWNCANDGQSQGCSKTVDVTCRGTPQCSCAGDGGCNSDCQVQAASYVNNACTKYGESGKKTWTCEAKTGKNYRDKPCETGSCKLPSCSCGTATHSRDDRPYRVPSGAVVA